MIYLLDVNVLVALFDGRHPNHEAAHEWFGKTGVRGWASCPLTELGLVRVLSHPSYPSVRGTVSDVSQRLGHLRAQRGHHGWPCDVSLNDSKLFAPENIAGPGQLTDVYLVGLAAHHGGRLATFDRRISPAAIRATNALTVLPA